MLCWTEDFGNVFSSELQLIHQYIHSFLPKRYFKGLQTSLRWEQIFLYKVIANNIQSGRHLKCTKGFCCAKSLADVTWIILVHFVFRVLKQNLFWVYVRHSKFLVLFHLVNLEYRKFFYTLMNCLLIQVDMVCDFFLQNIRNVVLLTISLGFHKMIFCSAFYLGFVCPYCC